MLIMAALFACRLLDILSVSGGQVFLAVLPGTVCRYDGSALQSPNQLQGDTLSSLMGTSAGWHA